MCQILINLADILEKIFINIVNSVCEHHESVIFVIYDPKNIYIDILHDCSANRHVVFYSDLTSYSVVS